MAKSNSTVVSREAQPTPPPADALPGLKTVHESRPDPSKQVDPPAPRSREELREQASKFLESSTVKNAPLSEKREFLLEKGLTEKEIDVLMQELEMTEKEKEKEKGEEKKEKEKEKEKEKHEATTTLEEGKQKVSLFPHILSRMRNRN